MALHKNLTGSDLHEPKGQATAAANTVYVADGAGSGTHQKITTDSLDLTDMESPNTVYLTAVLSDVSTASFVLVPAPGNCTFVSATSVLGGTISGANSAVSFTRNDGSSFGTAMTVAYSGSAEGDVDTFTATLNTTVTSPGYVKVATDGASTGAVPLYLLLKFTRVL